MMIICDEAALEKWSPDFSSSELADPLWTRVRFRGREVCNSLEAVDWTMNPVQTLLCDFCGSIGCSSGGWVHISRCGDWVIWTSPQQRIRDFVEDEFSFGDFGVPAFSGAAWERMRTIAPDLPRIDRLDTANGRALREAWVVGPGRAKIDDVVAMLKRRAVGTESMDAATAIGLVERWLKVLQSECSGNIRSARELEAVIKTIYFDGPSREDWPALAKVGAEVFPALSADQLFIPV